MIHTEVSVVNDGKKFYYSFVYVQNDRKDRKILWDTLVSLAGSIRGAWMVLGDFNAIWDMDARIGQHVRER